MKKNKKNRSFVIFISALLVAIIIVGLIFSVIKYNQHKREEIIIKDNVSVITSETEIEKQPIMLTEDEIVFNSNPNYSEGEIIVAGISDSTPTGFIRKVISTSEKDNQYIVNTENAVLTDVFEQAHITKIFALTEEGLAEVDSNKNDDLNKEKRKGAYAKPISKDVENSEALMSLLDNDEDYQFLKEFDFAPTDEISVNGEVGFSIWLEVEIEISHGNVIFGVTAHNKTGGVITIGASAGTEVEFNEELLSLNLPNFQFFIGFVPIVITNELQTTLEGEAYIQGSVETTLEIKSENASGFEYNSKNNKVKEIKEKKYLSDGIQWNTEMKFSGGSSVGVYLHLISKLYDCTGADIAVGIEGKAEGEVIVSPNSTSEGLNYVGSIDMSISPKLKGSIIVSVPIIDEKLAELSIFDVTLDPFWEKHWDSGDNWKEEMENLEASEMTDLQGLTNMYHTRVGDVDAVSVPQFQFKYSNNWTVKKEEIHVSPFTERDIIANSRGVTITYLNLDMMDGKIGGYGRFMDKIKISKVADSSFVPTTPDGTDTNLSSLGNFVVAKVKIIGSLYMDEDSDYKVVDGGVYYAVLPESYLGVHEEIRGLSGLYEECTFNYPAPIAFIADAPEGKFTADEEKEVIAILSSFKTE